MTLSGTRPRGGRFVALTTLAAVVALVAACSSDSKPTSSDSSAPASGGAAPADQKTVTIAIKSDGCKAQYDSYNTGPLTFDVSNVDATAVTEIEVLSEDRILGEKENLAPGFKGSFSLELQPGSYTVYCPGAGTEKSPLSITGTATTQAATDTKTILVQGAKAYQGYVVSQVAALSDAVTPLVTAIKANNVAEAQVAYAKARPFYERIEPVAESFPDLDPAIDARADDGVKPTQLTGFHRIEYSLFTLKSTAGLGPIADGLTANVAKLKTLVDGLNGFQPAELANGAVGLLDEAATSKITGEEERYSHIDLVDFEANVEGAQQAFAYLEDGLDKIDPALVATIKTAFTNMISLLAKYKDDTQPSGYKLYTSLTAADKKQLSQALQAVSEPLSRVAGKVVNA
jgi:iron uptake system component EfeO